MGPRMEAGGRSFSRGFIMSNGNTSGGGAAGASTTDSSIIRPPQSVNIVPASAAVGSAIGAAVRAALSNS
jgi:hypothetical protein